MDRKGKSRLSSVAEHIAEGYLHVVVIGAVVFGFCIYLRELPERTKK